MTLKLEVGKSYRRRDGERAFIVSNAGHNRYPFISDQGPTYTEKGRYDVDKDCDLDLVAEWEEPLPIS